MTETNKLEHWVAILTRADLPVLKQTARDLATLRADVKNLNAYSITEVITRDPIMTVKLLRYLQQHKGKAQTTEVVQVEQALLMLGVEPFFNKVAPQPLVEEVLKDHIVALAPMLRVVHRAHRASEYAKEWAVMLHDLHYDDVCVAALLHDIAETLMWCFAPDMMLKIRDLQQHDKAQRSHTIQEQVLGFTLDDLQKKLAVSWGLPQLLLMLMNDSSTKEPRIRNVELAINLARHSANGWDDAALPDDYQAIGELLHMSATEVMHMVATEDETASDINKPH